MPPNAAEAAAIIDNHVRFSPRDGAADWERLPELPSPGEIMDEQASSDDLPWFSLGKNNWKKSGYLEAIFRILRFEGVEGLRYSVKTLRSAPSMLDDDNTCVYTKVRVQGYLFTKMGPVARIAFSTQRAGAQIKWKQSKRLRAGKIVALSTDYFQHDCRVGVVAQRPIEGGLGLSPPVVDIFWGSIDQAVIDPNQDLIMVESRNGYYEAVRHALKGLQLASREWSPLDKYVQAYDDKDQNCKVASRKLNLSSLVDHLTCDQKEQAVNDTIRQQMFREIEDRFKECSMEARDLETIRPFTSLDDSQLEALERIVSKELAIVQGPPGTGKTFTSVKSLKTLLHNRQPGDSPIIVAAQTNHALDQLLIYCLAAGANIMRVGGRTENEAIAARTIYELRRTVMGRYSISDQYGALEKERRRIIERFQILVYGVFGREETQLLDAKTLLEKGVISQAQHDSLTDEDWEDDDDIPAMETWLGEEKIKRTQQRVDDLEFNDVEAADETVELEENINDQGDDDDDRIRGTFVAFSTHEQLTGQTPQMAGWDRRCRRLLQRVDNLFEIPTGIRGGVYQILQSKLREATAGQFREILKEAVEMGRRLKISSWTRDLNVIDKHCIDIMGCTTTGLTKYRGFLAAMKPRIMLIEEAAETREANITSALYPSIQQLILVGDHQQLPPSCDIARLAREPYNLNISLFERLVNGGVPYTMLDRQRRMAPELRYIVQKFYPKLKDHPLVTDITKRPLVPGMGNRRSFFFTHAWPEDTDADNSKFNQQEAEMVVAFMRYLLLNGVKASEITVLTYYKGQRRRILQRLRKKDIPHNNFFNVATVDSYQGEENEIVILSLVRSPPPGRDWNVGFVDSRNRATVAISRARRGFFMFGNKDNILQANLDSLDTWGPIWNGFAEQRAVAMGKGLPLVCQPHQKEFWVRDADGFVGNAGGCWIKCEGKLSCGHDCGLMCHHISHEKLPCLRACTRVLQCGHKCAGYCSDNCRCAQNCPGFSQIQLDKQMAQLQVAGSQRPGSELPQPLISDSSLRSGPGSGTKRQSPAEWQALAENPKAHDDAMRETYFQDLKDVRGKILDGGESSVATLNLAFEKIQDTFIPVADVDGRRIQGEKQTTDIREDFTGTQQQRPQVRPGGQLSKHGQGQFVTGGKSGSKGFVHGQDHGKQQQMQSRFPGKQSSAVISQGKKPAERNVSRRMSPEQWAARDPLYNLAPYMSIPIETESGLVAEEGSGDVDDNESLLIDFGDDNAGNTTESIGSQSQAGNDTIDTEDSSDGHVGDKSDKDMALIEF